MFCTSNRCDRLEKERKVSDLFTPLMEVAASEDAMGMNGVNRAAVVDNQCIGSRRDSDTKKKKKKIVQPKQFTVKGQLKG